MINDLMLEDERTKLSIVNLDNYSLLSPIAYEENLIQYSPTNISSSEHLRSYFEIAIKGHKNRTIIPFFIYEKKFKAYARSTRFGLINRTNKTLHIGWTWIGNKFQGTGLNKHVKFLMLRFAFETIEFEKVEFRIDERNSKSRRAVEKLGATLEGIVRKDTITKDGFRRNTCCYGILKEEWPDIKIKLMEAIY